MSRTPLQHAPVARGPERTPLDPKRTELVERLLDLARSRTGLELAWLSRFEDGDAVVCVMAGDGSPFGLAPGARGPLEPSYCIRVLDGRLTNAVCDTRGHPLTADLPPTTDLGFGAYVGVPYGDGPDGPMGMLCCTSADATELDDTDVTFLELLAAVASELLSDSAQAEAHQRITARVRRVLDEGDLRIVAQPIVCLRDEGGAMLGVEALTRFGPPPHRPDVWFEDAAAVGLDLELELAAIERALDVLPLVGDGRFLSINVSPTTAMDPALAEMLAPIDLSRLVLEITEHAAVASYETLNASLDHLRARGARLAIDDVGAGFATFRHVLHLAPDIIKLDGSIVRGIDFDRARRGLARGVVGVAREIGATVIAEGIETEGERRAAADVGVDMGQGWCIGGPGLPAAVLRAVP